MTKLYLIRHAEADGNLYRIAQGQYDSGITDLGCRQILALSERFASIPVDAVYASDLRRTCVTAKAICDPKGLVLHRRKDLREICVGAWEQKTWGEIARDTPAEMANFAKRLDLWQIPGAERPEAVRERMLRAVREIAAENEGRTAAVFSHGCALRILLAALEGRFIAEVGQTPHGSNTAVSLLEAEGDTLRIVFRDDVSHLQAAGLSTRHPNGLEPGACFAAASLPEQADWLGRCVESGFRDGGEPNPAEYADNAISQPERLTLLAEVSGRPVGVVQLDTEREASRNRGWISAFCVERGFRGKGYGVQLLGQAVSRYRGLDRRELCVALGAENGTAARFFAGYGFEKSGERETDGRELWVKSIELSHAGRVLDEMLGTGNSN